MNPGRLFMVSLCGLALAGCGPGVSDVVVSGALPSAGVLRIAVLDFDWAPVTGQVTVGHTMVNTPNAGKYVADRLSNQLLTIEGVEILERSKISRLLAERDMTQSQLVSQGRYEEIGRFLGVDYLVLGTVNSYTSWAKGVFTGHVVSFSSRCVEVSSSKVVWGFSGKAEAGPFGPLDPNHSLDRILADGIGKLRRLIRQHRQKT